jgi:hypothetical protein
MPMSYFFRVFVQDASDCDNDEDEWVSFDSVCLAADFGPRDADIFQDKDQERVARGELQKIAMYMGFRAVVPTDAGIDMLRTLFSLKQQELIVPTDMELYKYDNKQGKNAAILLSTMTFNSKIIGHSIDSSDNYDFRFQIVGGVGVRDASDMRGLSGMAEKETQVGPSPPSAEEGRRLAAAFMGIKYAAAREEVINLAERLSRIERYSASLGSVSRPWRKVRTITSSLRMRFWVEAGLAAVCGFLGILTLFTRDWIEALTGVDLDHKNGSFEWMIVTALLLVCILLSIAARAEWHRLSATAPAGI